MTWYPSYVQFFIACTRGNELKLQRVAELLYCAFCVYGADITSEYDDRTMPAIIKKEIPEMTCCKAYPWDETEDRSILKEFKSVMDDPNMIWVHVVTYNENPALEEFTMYTNFELVKEGKATQKDFDRFLERNLGKICFAFVGSGVEEIVNDYYNSLNQDDEDFDYDHVLPGAPLVSIQNTKLYELP